ncbi:MAG: DUF3307 domain-containing protein [Bacteroidales bacterium]|nr:DUF3307 domain-containing protein [Bacteroidales bacterium]
MEKLLILQFTAHILSDFILQSDAGCRDKEIHGIRSVSLYKHILIVFVTAWALSFQLTFWWCALLIAVLHYGIDLLKSYLQRRYANGKYFFLLDQALHVVATIVPVYLFFEMNGDAVSIPHWVPASNILLIIFAVLFNTKPANILIKEVFVFFSIQIPFKTDSDNTDLPNAGKLIGITERFLILLFIYIGQYELIGFLVAAKSILRFKDTDTLKTEYVLTGTLLSYSIAIISGILITFL